MAGKTKAADPQGKGTRKPRGRVSQSDVPRHTLAEAIRIPEIISGEFARQPTKPYYVADAVGVSPSSSRFRTLSGAAVAYGLTTGAYNSAEIGLTDLGVRAVAPTVDGDDLIAQREALMKPRVIREFLERYNDNPLPSDRIGQNVLEADLGVDSAATARTLKFIVDNAKSAGLTKEVASRTYIDLEAGGVLSLPPEEVDSPVDRPPLTEAVPPGGPEDRSGESSRPDRSSDLKVNRRVFITHGRNKKIVEQLKELLIFGDFEPIVSVERESVSKPVPDKVLEDMGSCAAAVIHVGTEQVLMDKEGTEHRVINSNVLIEIGAAMMRYGGKFILLVEQGTVLPSNLQGLYEVRYEGDALDYPATMKLLKAFNEFKS